MNARGLSRTGSFFLSKGHGFSHAVAPPRQIRLQPLRDALDELKLKYVRILYGSFEAEPFRNPVSRAALLLVQFALNLNGLRT